MIVLSRSVFFSGDVRQFPIGNSNSSNTKYIYGSPISNNSNTQISNYFLTVRTEWSGTVTSSFALTLQIQRIMALSLRRRRFSVSTFMAQVSAACSITLLTHDEYTLPLVRRGRWRLVRRGSNWRNLPHAHLQRVIAAGSQPPPAESMSPR